LSEFLWYSDAVPEFHEGREFGFLLGEFGFIIGSSFFCYEVIIHRSPLCGIYYRESSGSKQNNLLSFFGNLNYPYPHES